MNHANDRPFSKDILEIEDISAECEKIVTAIKEVTLNRLRRSGGIVGISGGIDSSVTMALAAKALGHDNVIGIMLPEKDSSPDSTRYAKKLADQFHVTAIEENITNALDGFGCYQRRDEAVRKLFPEYDPKTFKMKIGIKNAGVHTNLPPLFSVTIIDRNGKEYSDRLPANEFRQIEAASNFKQRSRMAMLYYHAERLHYAVIGTPNKHEVEQGFFVKNGDGGADLMPIAHLYKTQVYQLARFLNIPQEIIDRIPTTDTYSAEQTQEEFFFQLPFQQMDLLWYAFEHKYNPKEVGVVMDMTTEEVIKTFSGFERKIKTTEYLRMGPVKF